MTRFRLGTSCRDFVECCIFYFLFICSHFCNVTQGLRKYYWLGPFFKTHAVFVLTRGNNFLGLIANYVTHCVSLNTILSKHSCFGLKQIVLWDRQGWVSRISMENRIVIFLLNVYQKYEERISNSLASMFVSPSKSYGY